MGCCRESFGDTLQNFAKKQKICPLTMSELVELMIIAYNHSIIIHIHAAKLPLYIIIKTSR